MGWVWDIHAFLLLGESVGLVPVAHLQVVVIRGVEVVRLNVGAVVIVGRLQRRNHLTDEILRRSILVVLVIPVGVHLEVIPLPHRGDIHHRALRIHIREEIDRPRLKGAGDRVLSAAEGRLHSILSEYGLSRRHNLRLTLLVHPCHLLSFSV